VDPRVEIIQITPDAESLLENAIRVCYNSYDKSDGTIDGSRKLIKKIIENWHLDTLEHATATFKIVCSRSAMAQFTRHRHASFGVESQRYVKYENPVFIEIPHYSEGQIVYESIVKLAFEAYQKLIEVYGWKKEDARYVLPESWLTQFYVTMNFRSWRHFLELRLDKSAQWEIRNLAKQIFRLLYDDSPSCFVDLGAKFNILPQNEVESDES